MSRIDIYTVRLYKFGNKVGSCNALLLMAIGTHLQNLTLSRPMKTGSGFLFWAYAWTHMVPDSRIQTEIDIVFCMHLLFVEHTNIHYTHAYTVYMYILCVIIYNPEIKTQLWV